jgi:hypothetical protein
LQLENQERDHEPGEHAALLVEFHERSQ